MPSSFCGQGTTLVTEPTMERFEWTKYFANHVGAQIRNFNRLKYSAEDVVGFRWAFVPQRRAVKTMQIMWKEALRNNTTVIFSQGESLWSLFASSSDLFPKTFFYQARPWKKYRTDGCPWNEQLYEPTSQSAIELKYEYELMFIDEYIRYERGKNLITYTSVLVHETRGNCRFPNPGNEAIKFPGNR